VADIRNACGMLVVSCDKYADLWSPFFTLLGRFWPDCPFNVYLLTNRLKFSHPGVGCLSIGDDISWSDNLAAAVHQLPYEYIFLHLEDLLLTGPVDGERVTCAMNRAVALQANYIRLNPSQRPDRPYDDTLGLVSPGTVYRTSTVMSVWRKPVLLDLLRSGESAWDFEIRGSVRSDEYDGFYSVWQDCFPIINSVIKGKWTRTAVERLRSLGVKIDPASRAVMTQSEEMTFFWKRQRSRLLNVVPPRYRRTVRAFGTMARS
jgi:hypothetical protein